MNQILLVGNEKQTAGIAVCLLHAGHPVTLFAENETEVMEWMNMHMKDSYYEIGSNLRIIHELDAAQPSIGLVIAVTEEDVQKKKLLIQQIEAVIHANITIAINTETIPLSSLHADATYPERIIGVNWTEPAHTTRFLEIITNEITGEGSVNAFYQLSKNNWNKDPHILKNDVGIRSRLMGAMIREALHLVENGYVEFEDIDRANRNDAGYYLPFAGNFRYMDLMGTYIYGLVMQDLNPQLSKDRHLPECFNEIIARGGSGVKTKHGFYTYTEEEIEMQQQQFSRFSYEMEKLIDRYPFNYKGNAITKAG